MIEQPNFNYIDELSGEDIVFRNKFITIIKYEFPIEKEEYLSNVTNNRFKETANIVHKLKHKFIILGMVKSYKIATDYEMELLASKNDSEASFMEILENIETYIKTI